MPSAPRATCARALRRISPGRLARLTGCQLTAPVECSISSQGPPAMERTRSPLSAMSISDSGSVERT